MSTTVSIHITEDAPVTVRKSVPASWAKPESVRKRVSIPPSDLLVLEWWDAQVDPSTSIRLLIHEEASTNGVVDRMNRIGASIPAETPEPAADELSARRRRTAPRYESVAVTDASVAPFLPFIAVLVTGKAS